MVVSAVLSAVLSDLAVIVMMTPIALSITSSVAAGATRMSAAASLAVLYGAAAGGLATPAGIVFNALTLSLLDQLTGYSVSFGQWVSTGVILTTAQFSGLLSDPEAHAATRSAGHPRYSRPLSQGA